MGLAARFWKAACAEPYRLFFPLGIVFGIIGVAHWLWYVLGLSSHYSGTFHAGIQIELYLGCFVVGFLTTAIPRFSDTFSAEGYEVLVFLLLFGVIFGLLAAGNIALSRLTFTLLLVVLQVFIARRFLKSRVQYPPVEFVWIPFALIHGVLGSVITALVELGYMPLRFLDAAKPMMYQGFMLCLVIGIGSFLGSRIMGQQTLPNPQTLRMGVKEFRARRLLFHIALAVIVFISFSLEMTSFKQIGVWLRALAVTVSLWKGQALVFTPKAGGIFPRLVWLSFWLLTGGAWLTAIFPKYRLEALHFIFIGGYSLLTFAVATMVVYSHGGEGAAVYKSPWILRLVFFTVVPAVGLRAAAALLPQHYFMMLGFAASCWLAASIAWLFFALNWIWRLPRSETTSWSPGGLH